MELDPFEEEKAGAARDEFLFERSTTQRADLSDRKPFPVLLNETPAAPLSSTVKAGLWAAGILTGLLFLGSLLKIAR